MVRDLDMPLVIVGCETVREADGLAMSSRNGYLSVEERKKAIELNQILQDILQNISSGSRDFTGLRADAENALRAKGWLVDYIAVRSAADLAAPKPGDNHLVLLGAAKLGNTRLIDNFEIQLK